MINKLKLTACAAWLLCAACGGALSPRAFRQHIEDPANGFVQTAASGPYQITCIYTPATYLALQSFRGEPSDRAAFEAREKEFSAYDMYRLEITSQDPRDMQGLGEYFGFFMQNELAKVCGADTFPCEVYQAEPYNGIDGRQKIAVGFAGACAGPETLLLRATALGEPVQLAFDKQTLSIPTISLP